MSFYYNHTQAGNQFGARKALGDRQQLFPNPEGATSITVTGGQEAVGMYESIPDPGPPDAYYRRLTSEPVLTFEGLEYQAGSKVRETHQYEQISADDTLDRKNVEGEAYAQRILFSSAQTQDNPNVYIVTDQIQRARINNVSNFLADRMKDRVLGTDSALGYRPGTDPDPTTYWARDVKVRLVNANNGNTLIAESNEVEWGKVIKTIGLFDEDIASALDAYRIDISAAYDAYVADPTEANRTALISKDATDPAYGWPTFYDGPLSARVRVL